MALGTLSVRLQQRARSGRVLPFEVCFTDELSDDDEIRDSLANDRSPGRDLCARHRRTRREWVPQVAAAKRRLDLMAALDHVFAR